MFVFLLLMGSVVISFIIAYCIAIYDLHKDYKEYNEYFICLSEQSSYVFYNGDIVDKMYLHWKSKEKDIVSIKYVPLSFKDIMKFQPLNPDKWCINNGKGIFRHTPERYTSLYWLYNNEYIVYYKTYSDYKKGLKYKEQLKEAEEKAKQQQTQALENERLGCFLEDVQKDIDIIKQKAQEDIKKAAEATLTIADRLTAEHLAYTINSYFNTYGTKILLNDFAQHLATAYNCSYFDVVAIVEKLGGTICE